MTADEFKQARAQLDVSNYAMGPKLGVTSRQARRYESGESPISETVARLIRMYLRHGIPKGW